ncbi:alpha/beta-type small acid-soluble spore protein [Barrientosiimonas marina]|uniref:Small, acid-soluble spore protein, alpha/beta type n=1 Tax=Lentibacillus kimchii TaxID=1542911 RepID=A0ABW2UYI8_9BACI
MAGDKNNLLAPGAENALENMKQEIAQELDVEPGADTTARENGSVGGEMVKRMINIAEQSVSEKDK